MNLFSTILLFSLAIFDVQAGESLANFDGYIVKLKPQHGFMPLNNFLSMGEFTELNVGFGEFYHLDTFFGFAPVDIEGIRNNPNVEYIEPNYLYTSEDSSVTTKPDYVLDKSFSSQWSLLNDGHNTWIPGSPAGVDINAIKAWEITTGNRNIVIAVIDSGIDYNHPDLKSNLWVNEAEKDGLTGVDDDGNGFIDDIYGYNFATNTGDPMDGLGHGTHVAGIIGAAHNNEGIRGVMTNVRIMSLKFLTDAGPGDSKNAIRAIDYAIKNGAKIINNSWGGGEFSQAMRDAFAATVEGNIIVTVAAGNSKNDNDLKPLYPANYGFPNMISVAANNVLDKKANFSCYGKKTVDIFAPGVDIISTEKDKKESTYRFRSGTSEATPMVTGALGLLLSKEPNLGYAEAKARLIETSVKNEEYLKYAQGGRLDLYRLLTNQRQ